jgi:hypothetical protein
LFDWTLNEPLNVRFPETPLYLPVPLVTFATPLTDTLVGVAVPAAVPKLFEVTTVSINLLPPPEMKPWPVMGSVWLPAGAEPVPLTVLLPKSVPVPVPLTDVTLTEEAALPEVPTMSMLILPVYLPTKWTVFTAWLTAASCVWWLGEVMVAALDGMTIPIVARSPIAPTAIALRPIATSDPLLAALIRILIVFPSDFLYV